MQNAIKTMAAGAAIMLITIATGFAGPVGAPLVNGAAESGVTPVQYGYCQRLRLKCEHKNEFGQEGEGNCRRYRAKCGGWR